MFRKTISVILSFLIINIGFMHPRLSSAQEKTEYNIAVLVLDAHGIPQIEAMSLSSSLRVQVTRAVISEEFIKKSGISYTVVERSQMDKIFEQFDIQNTGCTDLSCAIEFGKMLSVERIIIGSVGLVGETYTINTSIVDVESSKALRVADYKFKGEVDNLLNEGIPDIVNQLLGIKKKSRKKLYIISGVVIVAVAAAAAILSSSDDSGDDTSDITINIPVPAD